MKSRKGNYAIIRKKKPDTDQIFLQFASSKKKVHERHQVLSKEEREKKWQYGCEQNQRLPEYR